MSDSPAPDTGDRVSITITDGIADVRLNRPDKRNALDNKMFAAIAEAGERLKTEPGVRVVVLSGEGASFCAGLDFSSFQAMAGAEADDAGSETKESRQESLTNDGPGSMAPGRITHL